MMSMNMAALWGLPVVFVCINNQYGMGTRVDQATANTAFDQRAHAFGLNGAVVDGIDVEEVKNAAQGLIDDARLGKPGFLSVTCYRFFGHARMDKSPYRAEAEELEGRKKDPVKFTRDQLVSSGLAQEGATKTPWITTLRRRWTPPSISPSSPRHRRSLQCSRMSTPSENLSPNPSAPVLTAYFPRTKHNDCHDLPRRAAQGAG
jgi:hypothetical protein